MNSNAKEEREIAAKTVLRSKCDNYFYKYLVQRMEQASFVKEIQTENSSYCATLRNLKNDHELGVSAKSALDAFEAEKKSSEVANFWKEIQNLKEEENAIRIASLGHLNIFGKALTRYANRTESTNLPTNLHHEQEVQQELPESGAEFNTLRIENQGCHEEKIKSDHNRLLNDNIDIITNGTDDYLREAVESMVGKVGSGILKVDDVNLEEIFEEYRDECENEFDLCHSDIMDLRPTSQLTKIIPEVTWEKFILDTYPNHNISEEWEELIQGFFKPKDTLAEWEKAWRGLFDEQESSEDLVIKDTLYNILSPYIEAFKAPFNILKSGDLEEKQYSSQFVTPILKITLNAICNMDWRILEVPIRSSKYRRNSDINPFIDKVLSAKRADGLARRWQSQEETFVYEQTGPPDVDDVTDFYVHDYKLVRTMRDVLNQRIILRLNDGIKDCDKLASFGALGHRDEVSLLWCTIHLRSYCLREYGSFRIPTIWQDLPVLSEAIITCLKFFSFMKDNTTKIESRVNQKMKLLSKRKVHTVTPNPPTPDRSKKQPKRQSKKQKK